MAKLEHKGQRKGLKTIARMCRDASEMHFDVLKKRVGEFKNSEEGRQSMCKAVEEFAERRAAFRSFRSRSFRRKWRRASKGDANRA